MALTFYYGSGSPYAWRVWLALEHKAIAYELKAVSFSTGDLTKPEFLALNPRHKVPTIADGNFSLYESAANCPRRISRSIRSSRCACAWRRRNPI